jgi:hypothetical protein
MPSSGSPVLSKAHCRHICKRLLASKMKPGITDTGAICKMLANGRMEVEKGLNDICAM